MKVIAIQPGFFNARVYEAGEEFEIKAKNGLRFDASGRKLLNVNISEDEQFSEKWMKKLEGAAEAYPVVDVVVDAAPKKKGRPFSVKVESNNLDVI